MTQTVETKRPTPAPRPTTVTVGRYGLLTAIVGALLVLADGITVLVRNSVIAPSYFGVSVVGWGEVVLSLLALAALYFYRSHSTVAALSVGILAAIAFFVDGGFFYVGAAVALIGAIVIYFRRKSAVLGGTMILPSLFFESGKGFLES